MIFTRYALFHLPPAGALAGFGAAWLGWDNISGVAPSPLEVAGLPRPLAEITRRPRKYGLHGTFKPPFRLAFGMRQDELEQTLCQFAANRAALALPQLVLGRMGGFLALQPARADTALTTLAADIVQQFDPFRAALTDADLARHSTPHLTPAQQANLQRWGYPYVMDDFRFHLTLTGALGPDLPAVQAALQPLVTPLVPQPYRIADLCLLGEAADGRFHLIRRAPFQ